jgi:hypothetical protein
VFAPPQQKIIYKEEGAFVCAFDVYTFPHHHTYQISTEYGIMVDDLPGKVSDTS